MGFVTVHVLPPPPGPIVLPILAITPVRLQDISHGNKPRLRRGENASEKTTGFYRLTLFLPKRRSIYENVNHKPDGRVMYDGDNRKHIRFCNRSECNWPRSETGKVHRFIYKESSLYTVNNSCAKIQKYIWISKKHILG